MKKIAVISFTENGSRLAEKLREELGDRFEITLSEKYKKAERPVKESLSAWTKRQFQTKDGILYVGAAGIAVRAIAPYVRGKAEDPAVLVIDEQGRYCIPILSGHLGGANELAVLTAKRIGAQAVITTATDLNGKWAADVFAKKNHLTVSDMKKAKEISARLLDGERLSLYVEKSCGEIRGNLPEELYRLTDTQACGGEGMGRIPDIVIGVRKNPCWEQTLYLIPKTVTLGIGCKRGVSGARVERSILRLLEKQGIFPESIEKIASIDLKKDEKGILFCIEKYGWEYVTYAADELRSAEGNFQKSSFVQSVTGVDNVCERSAVCASAGGELLARKQAADGVTVAAAVRKRSIQFE